MTVCNYFLEGRCRYGEKCWNEHPRGGRAQTRGGGGGGGSVNRVWVNPSQRTGGGMVQPSAFGRGGGDWGRGSGGTGRDDRSSNFSFTTQNRFSNLSNTQGGYGRTGGGGGGDDTEKQLEMIQKDMEVWQSSGQWLFSCYALLKTCISGFVELSPEELRTEYYTSRATGDVQSYSNSVQQLVNQWRSRVQELRTMSGNTRASMVAELSNPGAQTSSLSSAGFGSSSSAGFGSSSSTGFGSSSSAGFGSSSSAGFGSSSSTGFGSSSTSGFGSSSTSGFSSSSSGFGVGGFSSSVQSSAAGFSFSASSPGFGSSGSLPGSSQFSSSAPSASTFSFSNPAATTAGKSSAAVFSFSSGSSGGFGGSSTAPSVGAFSSGASVAGSAEDRKGGGDGLYTPLSDLTPDELREFTAKRFTLGQIPLRPPPADLLSV